MTAHVTRHEQNITAPRAGTALTWWAPRLLLVAMGALLGAELGVWVSEAATTTGEIDRIAQSLGIGSHHATASTSSGAIVAAATGASTYVQNDAWHQTAVPGAAIPTVDVSVLPRASDGSSSPSHASASSHHGPRSTTRSARARAPKQDQEALAGKDDAVAPAAPVDPSTLSTALSDALGE
jgi:hypothetical protein